MRRFGEPRLVVVARWIWLCELIPLPRQELPAAILLLPDLQRADPGAVGLAVQLAFRNVEMAGNRTAADDRVFASMRLNQVDAAQSNRESGRAATGATQLPGGFAAFWRRTISAFNCRIMRANSGLL